MNKFIEQALDAGPRLIQMIVSFLQSDEFKNLISTLISFLVSVSHILTGTSHAAQPEVNVSGR